MVMQLMRTSSLPKACESTQTSMADTVIAIDITGSAESLKNDTDNTKTLQPVPSTSVAVETEQNHSCLTASFPSLILFTLIMISTVLGRQYIKDMLIYIDSLDVWESTVLFAVMFTIVAFPIMWGYVLLNIACGYTYGFLYGTLMTAGCVTYAIICSHLIIRRFFKSHVEKTYIVNERTKALMKVVAGPNGYKIVFLTRFTPIPFGIQNAIFAVSDIKPVPYILASELGLLLTQSAYAYMGSTLRSIAEVFSDGNSITAWILLGAQIVITIGLTVFIIRLAKHELDNNIPGNPTTESKASQTVGDNSTVRRYSDKRSRSHSRNLSVNIPPIHTPAEQV